MGLRDKLASIFDVVLRVPPLFVVDQVFMSKFGQIPFLPLLDENADSTGTINTIALSPSAASDSSSLNDENYLLQQFTSSQLNDSSFFNVTSSLNDTSYILLSNTPYINQILWLILYLQCLFLSTCVFLLPTKSLFILYMWLTSIALVLWSFFCNESYVQYIASVHESSLATQLFESYNMSAWFKLAANYFIQVILSLTFCYISSYIEFIPHFLPCRIAGALFISPTIISLLPSSLPSTNAWIRYLLGNHYVVSHESLYSKIRSFALHLSPSVSLTVALAYLFVNVFFASKRIFTNIIHDLQWCRTIANHYGFYTLLENQWNRLHVPQVLRVFWLTRLTEQAVMMLADSTSQAYYESGIVTFSFNATATAEATKSLIIRGCETTIAVLGMTSVISSISHQIGCIIQWILAVEDSEDRNIGTVSSLLFFILSLQTGITGMEPEKRFIRLYRNLCLLFTAILHFIHNMVNPLLNSLSASRNMSIQRHARALAVCLFLIAFPAWFLKYLWFKEKVSTWLLAVSAFSIEVIIKVVISLLIYALFMIDAFRTTVWEPLDDYVYVIKATGSSIEFIFGIFLFFNGAWILLFESGGTIRAAMMCIHAYFNIWLQAKLGWQKFIRRRNAVHKINSFPEATEQQLRDFDDVCAICYQELSSARITRCKHYFHGVCLRKWLYVQDICPLCHEELCVESENNSTSNSNSNNSNNSSNHHEAAAQNDADDDEDELRDQESAQFTSDLRNNQEAVSNEPPDTSSRGDEQDAYQTPVDADDATFTPLLDN